MSHSRYSPKHILTAPSRRFRYIYNREHGERLPYTAEGQAASDAIKEALEDSSPRMISRFGRNELRTLLRRWNRLRGGTLAASLAYLSGQRGKFWWDQQIKDPMMKVAGFFHSDNASYDRFSDLYIRDMREIDILGAWCPGETLIESNLSLSASIPLGDLEPYVHEDPWSIALEDKTVLVVHPFEHSIRTQYERRELLFNDSRVLPTFELKTLKAVQTHGSGNGKFNDWFNALDWMCEQISSTAFDIALIGAGAYGLPLAAHVKRIGKKAVHIGGATQLMFGIRGRRWENNPGHARFFNANWIRPSPNETPTTVNEVENGCYW